LKKGSEWERRINKYREVEVREGMKVDVNKEERSTI
jgi:hypothetical protein